MSETGNPFFRRIAVYGSAVVLAILIGGIFALSILPRALSPPVPPGAIGGSVADCSGYPIAGATINVALGGIRVGSGTTNSLGQFVVFGTGGPIPSGTVITITAQGYMSAIVTAKPGDYLAIRLPRSPTPAGVCP